MPKARPETPIYRCKKDGNYRYGLVTLYDVETGATKDYRIGTFGEPESLRAYGDLVAKWKADGRRLSDATVASVVNGSQAITVTEFVLRYVTAIAGIYSRGEERNIKAGIRVLRELCGHLPAAGIGPNTLRAVRDSMVAGRREGHKPRRPWGRKYANTQTRRLVAAFKWAVAHELVPAGVYQALAALEPLKRGRTTAAESEPVRPVSDATVAATLPFLNAQIGTMVRLQLLTGMRPGEVVQIRTADLDLGGDVWLYRPPCHKNAYRGHGRIVCIGPQAQVILKPWLRQNVSEPLFSPAEAEQTRQTERHQQRKTPDGYGNAPGTNRRDHPRRKPGAAYTADSYRRAIRRACRDAGIEAWHPHQLRHAAATKIRAVFGLEAAQLTLGHSSAVVTDAVYAERDLRKVADVARAIG